MQERQRSWSVVWDWTSVESRRVSMRRLSHWSGQQQHLLQWPKHWVHKKCSGLKRLKKDPDYRCTGCQGTACPFDGTPQKEVQVEPDKLEVVASFCYLGDMLSAAGGCELSNTTRAKTASQKFKDLLPVLSSCHLSFKTRGCVYSSCVRSTMPARIGHWQSQTSSVCSEMTGQWLDRSAMSECTTLTPPGPMSYLCSLALRIWTSFWSRENSDGMDMWNAPMVVKTAFDINRLMENMGLGGLRWHGNSWQRGTAERRSSRPLTLMIDIPGDLVWDLPCVQQASYLEGVSLAWMLPLYLHINQKSDYDMMMIWSGTI